MEKEKPKFDKVRVTYRKNGSLKVFGDFEIQLPDGTIVAKDYASFCRCGLSREMPFCDGRHRDECWVEHDDSQGNK